jgi:hypothetical protein
LVVVLPRLRKSGLVIDGACHPRSKFLGNSAASILDGRATIYFLGRPGETYVFTFPSYYVKGVVFGKLTMEIGDKATLECAATGWSAEVEFKTKGVVFGRADENKAVATVKHNGDKKFTVQGYWDDVIDIVPYGDKKAQPEE